MASIDGWDLRNEFLKVKDSEAEIVSFLERVGVWQAVEDRVSEASTGQRLMSGAFGARWFIGRALPVRIQEFRRDRDTWRRWLSDPKELRRQLGPPPTPGAPPAKAAEFAVLSRLLGQLPLRVEWRSGAPISFVETITGWEMVVAATHADLMRNATFRICAREDCRTPFPLLTNHDKIYCEKYCGHLVAVREGRQKKARKKNK